MRRTATSFLFLGLLLYAAPALADDIDIFGQNIAPNVMILFDNSGSMNNEIISNPYAPSTTYPGSYTSTAVYKCTKARGGGGRCRYTKYTDTISQVNNASARQALSTNGYWTGRIAGSSLNLYAGNYINYANCASCLNYQRKIDIAKTVVTNLINSVDGVNFGLMDFKYDPLGGKMVAPIGTPKATLIADLNAIVAENSTPLGEMLRDAGKYYSGTYPGYTSPIEYSCQPNFVILMTDGMQNGSVDVRTQATTEFTTDHSSAFAGLQNVVTYTIGFGLAASDISAGAPAVLQQTATNGGGAYYTANDTAQLDAALQDAIRQIVASSFSFSTPVIPTTGTSGSDKTYLASFQSNPSSAFWRGYLKAYQRGSNGLVPVDSNGVPLASALVWDAGQVLASTPAASRTIFTLVGGTRQDFNTSNAALTPALFGLSATTDRDNLIKFIRGVDAYDENANSNTTEDRAWKLGDIMHSSPVLVGPPSVPSTDASYLAFQQANATRTTVLIAGANDGMLHAFRASDGAELWAFIPPDLFDNLNNLAPPAVEHSYFVDGSPIAADIQIGGTWKTILVFGERRGGPYYYAFDITDPTNPGYLWSFTDPNIYGSWSVPAIGKVAMADGTTKFVAFFGGGYDTPNNNAQGTAFYAVDLATGAKLWDYGNATSPTGDEQYMKFSLVATPTPVDLNNDGFVDRVYLGDVGGQLWKFDLSAPATLSAGRVTNWTGKRLFVADPSQPVPPPAGDYYPAQAIYDPPTVAFDKQGNLWVYFGTGDLNHPNNGSANRFYGIKEDTSMTNGSALTESSLTNVSTASATPVQGWFFLLAANEKALSSATVFNSVVLFSAFLPATTVACGNGGGTATLYAVQMLSGYAGVDWTTGLPFTTNDPSKARSTVIGTGIPASPVVILTQSGTTITTTAVTATTSSQLPSNPVPPPSSMKRVLYWREVF